MTRAFTANAILIVSLNLLVKSFYLFGIDRTVQNTLPEGEYGLYFTLFNFAFLFQVVSDFGLHNFNARHVAQSRHLLGKYFPHLFSLKLLLGLGFFLLLALVGGTMGFSGLCLVAVVTHWNQPGVADTGTFPAFQSSGTGIVPGG
jgi:O-antigen/teichoic acid export membrane protein